MKASNNGKPFWTRREFVAKGVAFEYPSLNEVCKKGDEYHCGQNQSHANQRYACELASTSSDMVSIYR